MTQASAVAQTAPRRSRRIVVITLAIIAALVAAFFAFANLYADWLWYTQLGYQGVLVTQWTGRVVMFAVGFAGMALPVFAAIQLAYRLRPVYARLSSQLDRYQEVVEPLRRLAMWGIPVFFGFFAGFATSTQWDVTWLWFNGVQTSTTDPQFGLDTGFYLFAMPFYTALVGYLSAVVLVALAVTVIVAYLYGSVRITGRELRISKAARIQIAVVAGLYLLLQAASLWLDRFRTLVEDNDRITGPGFTGVNFVIPGLTILSLSAVVVALLFFVTAAIGRWRFPLIGVPLLLVTAIVVGAAVPWAVNTFQVRPNQLQLEREYYQRNLDATQEAYGIGGLEKSDFEAVSTAEPGQLRSDAGTTAQIRIMDPAIISPTVRQQEQFRPYYQFQDTLDVDRYQIDGQSQDTVVSVRELDIDALGTAATWQNTALVYTHGYGLVAAKGNARTSDGFPEYLERGIPTSGTLTGDEAFEPRVYFGEASPTYSIVGASAEADPIELDYPRGSGDGGTDTRTTFTGDGGPSVGSVFNRLIYSLKFQSEQILFSDNVNADSQILYDRDPRTRVQKAAPYLELDSDPYPSVVDGRIVWIIDGYTLSANYPYARTVGLASAISDSNNPAPRFALDNINYIRNSVKATVDAYDGTVTLYAWDDQDPILQSWQNVYPSTLKPISEMSGDLMSHVRYPTDLFKVQRAMLQIYHVDTGQSFYERDNAWATPADPQTASQLQPPYYLTMQMPGQEVPSFSMFTSFIPAADGSGNSRNVLLGYLSVDSNAGSEAGVKAEDYGTLRMLVIDADTTVSGPGQVQNDFNADPTVSSQLNLLSQGQSAVLSGNLLTLPVGGGLLYVQPVFVQSSEGTQLPTLQKVLVSFGDQIAFENTLNEALDVLFGGDSGADAGDDGVVPTGTAPPTATPTTGPTTAPDDGTVTSEYDAALEEARQAIAAKQAALTAGDLTAFAAADARLTAAVQTLLELGPQ